MRPWSFLVFAFFFGCDDDARIHPVDAGADSGVAPMDAADDTYNGAPSTDYPAPHPPLPQLVNTMKGPVLKAPTIYMIFYPSYALESQLVDFAKSMVQTTYWGATTSEYGVGKILYGGTIDLADTPPATIGQTDIQTWMAGKLQSGAFGVPDPQAIYTIVYPSTTVVTQPNPVSPFLDTVKSCTSFLGYHDNVSATVGDAGTQDFAYAVIPTCGQIHSLTETLSHEWIEAATDPLVTSGGTFTLTGGPNSAYYSPDPDHIVWSLLGGGEAGDLCEPEGSSIFFTPPDLAQPVQRTWSNISAAASHDPCVPRAAGAFFDSAPVLTDTVSFDSQLTGKVTSKGIKIAQGESKTIEVDLFSDGDTGGPWTVTADDVLSTYYSSFGVKPSMAFEWDRTSGVNGEKLHLTITVTGPSPVGGAHAFMIQSWLGSRTTAWAGLVVE